MTCSICKFDPSSIYPRGKLVNGLCWTCHFWQPLLAHRYELCSARHRSRYYVVHGELELHHTFESGVRYQFEFHDGRVVLTTNVTCHGAIPAQFLHDLPNNVRSLATNSHRAKLLEAVKTELPESCYGNPAYEDEEFEPRVRERVTLPPVQQPLLWE